MGISRFILFVWVAVMGLAAAQTRIHVTGMQHKSEAEVLELLGGRLAHVRKSPAAPALADDAAFLLRQTMRKDGYMEAEVQWKIVGPREIVLQVREGTRHSLGEVTVTGVPDVDAKKLAKLFARAAEKGRPFGAGPPPFRESDIDTGLSYIRQELNANGYWAAEVKLVDRQDDRTTGATSLTIAVQPGPLHRIGRPLVRNSPPAAVELTQSAAQPYIGREATTANLNGMRAAVEAAATARGYPEAKIEVTQVLERALFIPSLTLDLGKRVHLRQIHIAGLERTNPERVAQRVDAMQGAWYDQAAMNRKLREFLATGAFTSARVETTEVGDDSVDATLLFEEAPAREISLGAGVGSYQGFVTRTSYSDRNFLGNLMGFSAGFELGSRGLLGEVRLTDPWWYGSDVATTARAYLLTFTREGYLVKKAGLEGKAEWKATPHYALELLGDVAWVNTDEDGLPVWTLGEGTYTQPRLRLTQKLDYRDNPVLPKRGWHLECPLEVGAAMGETSTSYFLGGVSGGWYRQLNPAYQLGVGGKLNVIVPQDDGTDLPIDMRLFNGGVRSVRSFPERELGPTVDGYPVGGEAAWSTNVELIRNLGAVVKAVAFFDAGSVARNYDDLGSSGVELATGLGLRLDLPIGPVRLEYGLNLTRDPGEPAGTFHFAIGYAY